jgi:hypothetical protein
MLLFEKGAGGVVIRPFLLSKADLVSFSMSSQLCGTMLARPYLQTVIRYKYTNILL